VTRNGLGEWRYSDGIDGIHWGARAANLLRDHGAALNVLVRARDVSEAEGRLWQALQLHLEFPQFMNITNEGAVVPRRFDGAGVRTGAR